MYSKLKSIAARVKRELKLYKLVLKDIRTPKPAKILLGIAFVYAISPIDLIPDFIPVIGYLDDIIILPALVFGALKLVPKEVVEDCRLRAESA